MHLCSISKSLACLVLFVLCLLGLSSSIAGQNQPASYIYDEKVRIEPKAGWISAQMTVEFRLATPSAKDFTFNLHETFQINKLLINGKAATFVSAPNPSRMTPAAKAITVAVPEAAPSGNIRMEIEYQGKLKQLPEWGAEGVGPLFLDDQVNSRMVELAGYGSWYPQFVLGEPVELRLELWLPSGWVAICSGTKTGERFQKGWVITNWYSQKDLDTTITAAPNYKKLAARRSNVQIEIYHTSMPQEFLEREVDQIASAVSFYTAELGQTNIPGGTIRQVYSPKRKGQGKAGFARPGLFVTSEGLTLESIENEPGFSLLQPIAHEIAHSWWNFGVGQGDWINESFAEYYSALAVRKATGEEDFQKVLAEYRTHVVGLPTDSVSLSQVPFLNDNVGFVVRYYKGALMLDHFRQVMGDKQFFSACHGFFSTYTGKPTGTADFRSFWKERLGDKSQLVDRWIDAKGGLPELLESKPAEIKPAPLQSRKR